MTTKPLFETEEDKELFQKLFLEQLEKQKMSNYYEPKRESYYMGDEDDWRVLWPKNLYGQEFETVFGKVPKEPSQPVTVKKHTDGTRTIQVGGSHYKDKAMQPWDIIDAWELNFYAGNVVKYILRYRHKDGLQDLQKARHYIDKLIEDYADPT